jgi:SET domain-containing protein
MIIGNVIAPKLIQCPNGDSFMTSSSKLANAQTALIEVRDSKLHGLGVFACVDLPKGSVIERCFYLVIDDDDLQEINRLNDYLFTSPDVKSDYLCVLGCGMIYNHGVPPNAEWQIADDDNRFIEFTALVDIKAGDEILHDYGSDYWESRT